MDIGGCQLLVIPRKVTDLCFAVARLLSKIVLMLVPTASLFVVLKTLNLLFCQNTF